LPKIEDSISQNLIQWLCDPLLSTNCHVQAEGIIFPISERADLNR